MTLLACGTVHAATTVPGLIQMEDYDQGGEGVGYHDTTPGNQGGLYRSDGVDIYNTWQAANGYAVEVATGEWLAYTVDVKTSGFYNILLRYNLPDDPFFTNTGRLHIESKGVDISGAVQLLNLPITELDVWNVAEVRNIQLAAGVQVIKVAVDFVDNTEPWMHTYLDCMRIVPTPTPRMQVVAGSGQAGFQDGTASEARFSSVISGMDVDSSGSIYLADAGNLRVRKVDASGTVTTFAGTGQAGATDGPGAQAQFADLTRLVVYGEGSGNTLGVDVHGNIYVLDRDVAGQLSKIRKITPQQQVSTFYSMNTLGGKANLLALAIINQENVLCISETNTLGQIMGTLYNEVVQFSPNQDITRVSQKLGTGTAGDRYFDLASYHGTDWVAWNSSWSIGRSWRSVNWMGSTFVPIINGRDSSAMGLAMVSTNQVYIQMQNAIYQVFPQVPKLLKIFETPGLTGPLAVDGQGNLLTMVSNKVVRLVMNEVGYSVVADAPGGGVVELTPPAGSYPANTTISAKAQPASGWSFLHWANDVSGTINPTNVVLTSDKRITAVFGAPVAITAAHATVTRTPDQALYEYGTKVTVQVTPDEGYEFTGWSDGNTYATRELTVTELINLSANVAALPAYTITAQALGGIGGQVELVPNRATYYRDTVVTLTARPQAGYVFQVWLDNVLSNPRTITVTSNTTLFAVFATGEGVVPTVQLTGVPTTSVNLGSRVEVVAQATGSSPLEYTWKHNGTTMSTTGATLVIESVQSADLGSYEVEVSNGNGKANASFTLSASGCINIQSIQMNEQHQPVLTVCSPAGMACVLQYSADMGSWQDGVTFTNASGTMTLEAVPQGQTNYMFYRVIKK